VGAKDFAFHRSISADWLCEPLSLSGRLGQKINHFLLPEIDSKFLIYPAGNLVYIPYIFFLCSHNNNNNNNNNNNDKVQNLYHGK
jgi:hypothetical protein